MSRKLLLVQCTACLSVSFLLLCTDLSTSVLLITAESRSCLDTERSSAAVLAESAAYLAASGAHLAEPVADLVDSYLAMERFAPLRESAVKGEAFSGNTVVVGLQELWTAELDLPAASPR
jgi:hypothetical protein